MARSISVEPAQLRAWAAEIRELGAKYQSDYTAIQTTVDGLGATWSGEDNLAYVKKVREFDDDFLKMFKEIKQYASYLEKTAKVYEVVKNVAQRKAGGLSGHYNAGASAEAKGGSSGGGGGGGGGGFR